ncbi:MAG: hypothetical protein Kow0040_10610 [Thermogutta sp.]
MSVSSVGTPYAQRGFGETFLTLGNRDTMLIGGFSREKSASGAGVPAETK